MESKDILNTLVPNLESEVQCLTPVKVSSPNIESVERESNEMQLSEGTEFAAEEKEKKKVLLERKQSQALLDSFDPISIKHKCPERIIICIDLSDETESNLFTSSDGNCKPMIKVVQNALRVFALNKHSMDSRHEFALMVLHDTCVWVTEFSSDPHRFIKELEETNELIPCDSFNLSSLFEIILEEVSLADGNAGTNDEYVLRAILIYGRSKTLPTLKPECQALKTLTNTKNFFMDVLFVHNDGIEDHKVQEIYDFFCNLDSKDVSYIYEVTDDPVQLHNYTAMLLAHPLQRPPQCARDHQIKSSRVSTPKHEEIIL